MDARRNLLSNATLQMALVIAIVILANIFSSTAFGRLDVTRDRLHSLDDASKRIVAGMDRPLVVRAYFTRGLEAPYNNNEQIVTDKLNEFQAYSAGKMKVTVVDPTSNPDLLKEAQKYGLTELQYTVHHADRAELRKIWMGAVLLYGDRVEVLPSLSSLGSLEYDVSSAIHRLRTKAKDIPVLAYSTGHGEPDLAKPEGPMTAIVESLSQKFVLRPVELGGPGLLHEDVDALLVIGPQSPMSDRALYQIDQFIERGGAAALFVTNNRPDLRNFRAQRVSGGLEPLLGNYGVQVNKDIVIDRVSNGAMRFPVRVGNKTTARDVNYPLIPKATELSKRSTLTSGLDSMLFPFASTITLAEPLPSGVDVDVLARTSAASGSVQSVKTVDPTQLGEVMPDEKRGPFPVLVAITGSFRSFFETRPVPAPATDIAEDQDGIGPDATQLLEGAPTRLILGGSADFVANNPAFMLNMCDWLIQDESLIGIRSKIATVPSLAPTSGTAQLGWKAFNLLTAPILLLALGGARQLAFRRRARRAA